jgi:hypothetical protein
MLFLGFCPAACRSTHETAGSVQDAAPDLTFEEGGETYVIAGGNAYRVRPDGRREFLERLYDPDFFAKNYTVRDGQVFQVDRDSGRLYPVSRNFSEDFERAASTDDLLTPSRWHYSTTDPKRADQEGNYYNLGNRITVSRDVVHGGNASARFHARPSSRIASKSSLSRNIMYFKKGDHVYFSGWFFIEDTPTIYDGGGVTLVDLESGFMQSVGLRIIFRSNDSLGFELELPKTQFRQDRGSEVKFPTGRWVHVEFHAFLSDEDGLVQIWQDGQKVLDKPGRTLPLPEAIYDRFEVGVSALARGSQYEKVLYVDDIVISDSPIR